MIGGKCNETPQQLQIQNGQGLIKLKARNQGAIAAGLVLMLLPWV